MPQLRAIESRAAELVGLPPGHVEPLQVRECVHEGVRGGVRCAGVLRGAILLQ